MHCLSLVEMIPLDSIFFNVESMAVLKSVADKWSLCLDLKFSSEFVVYFYYWACSQKC